MHRLVFSSLLAIAFALIPRLPAAAYGIPVHRLLPRFTWRAAALAPRQPAVTPAQLQGFRGRFYRTAATLPEKALRRRFLARFPTVEGFSSTAFREFLALNPQATVWGLDAGPDTPMSLGAVLAQAAAAPDVDGRNQSRLLRDRQGRPIRLTDGSLIPIDPMITAMGRPTGVSSQAHAHYGLIPGPKSDDPAVLKADPRRFAIPPNIETYAAANGQLWTDMAVAAQVWGLPTLARIHEGAWQHYAADVANQVHTVQVGIYDFFVAAKLQSYKELLLTMGGWLRPAQAFRDIGITIVANHHFLSEDFFVKRMIDVVEGRPQQRPEAARVVAALDRGDPAFERRLMALASRPSWARSWIEALSDVSSREGADLYRSTHGFAQRRLSVAGVVFEPERDDPDAFVRPDSETGVAEAFGRYYHLYESAFGRVGSIFRLWEKRFAEAVKPPGADREAVARIVRQQLDYWEAADARRVRFLADKGLPGDQVGLKSR